MASFPLPGSVTVCEINRELITTNNLSDDGANDTYGKALGMVFSPVQFQRDIGPEQENGDIIERKKSFSQRIFSRLISPTDVSLLKDVDLQGVSWHQHKHILAFISSPNQVIIRDYEDSEGKEPQVLSHELQKCVISVAWRPNGGKSLAVACKGGICIWSASSPGNMPFMRPGIAALKSFSRGHGPRWTLVDFLGTKSDEQISALSWSPDGRYLASGSYDSSSFSIWDVAQGVATPVRQGFGGILMLRWSPTGDYFFAAKVDGTFYLWETNTWTSEPWSSSGGFVSGATWDSNGSKILIAFSESSTLGCLHFSARPPSLDGHLLPVDLPEIASLTDSQGIDKMAWDASGERLAISYKGGDENYKGLIALYDTRSNPVISTSLIGFIRGPGENPYPIGFSFHDKFKQGPLLSVCWSSGYCCTYPFLFR